MVDYSKFNVMVGTGIRNYDPSEAYPGEHIPNVSVEVTSPKGGVALPARPLIIFDWDDTLSPRGRARGRADSNRTTTVGAEAFEHHALTPSPGDACRCAGAQKSR